MQNVVIRPTTLADLPSLVECLNGVFLERKYLAIVEAIPIGEAIGFHATRITAGHPHLSQLTVIAWSGCVMLDPLHPRA